MGDHENITCGSPCCLGDLAPLEEILPSAEHSASEPRLVRGPGKLAPFQDAPLLPLSDVHTHTHQVCQFRQSTVRDADTLNNCGWSQQPGHGMPGHAMLCHAMPCGDRIPLLESSNSHAAEGLAFHKQNPRVASSPLRLGMQDGCSGGERRGAGLRSRYGFRGGQAGLACRGGCRGPSHKLDAPRSAALRGTALFLRRHRLSHRHEEVLLGHAGRVKRLRRGATVGKRGLGEELHREALP